MSRSVAAEESLLKYLQNLSKTEICSIGLILGQPTEVKDFVIHLARTPQPAKKNVSEENLVVNTEEAVERKQKMSNFGEVPEFWVGDHAKHVTRMLPGGMYVLGIFVISVEDLFSTHLTKIRNILNQMNKNLNLNGYLHGSCSMTNEKLVLIYNPTRKNYDCKRIDSKTGAQRQIDLKFIPKITKWHQLDCNYQFDQLIPIEQYNLKQQLNTILHEAESSLHNGVVMLDGEIRSKSESIESLGKKKQIKNKNQIQQEPKNIQVNIFIPGNSTNPDSNLISCCGDMHFSGQLASRVFLNQKATVEDATTAIREDIIRSLAARLEMHSDSLIEDETMSPEEKSSIHEPPRRVLVALPSSKITLSDYLFPGEGPSEALISLEELLDLSVTEEDVIKDLEVQAEQSDYYRSEEGSVGAGGVKKQQSDGIISGRGDSRIYFIGLGIAILVLVISLFIPFFNLY